MVGLVQRFRLAILLALCVAVPYVMTSNSVGSMRERVLGLLSSETDEPATIEGISDPEVSRLLAMQQQLDSSVPSSAAHTGLTPTVRLEQVLRFDVHPRWVMQNWPHVATTRTDGLLDGLRVPLMTGTGPADVTGSLTYYFDRQEQVQRIALEGVMGDDRQLVTLTTQMFELKPEPVAGIGLYLTKWNGTPISALWIRRQPVVHTTGSAPKFEFVLELNRPGNYHGLSPRLQERIQNAHASLAGDTWR
jgi:hypothetical protein